MGGLVLLPFVPISSPHLAPSTIGLLIVAGLTWTMSILAEYKSHVSLQVGVGALISSVRAVLLVLVGATFFGEAFTRQDTLGAVLAIAGVLIACPLHPQLTHIWAKVTKIQNEPPKHHSSVEYSANRCHVLKTSMHL